MRGGQAGWLGGFAELVLQVLHVEIAVRLEPVLMRPHRQRRQQEAALGKIRLTQVRLLISSICHSSMLVLLRCL